MKSKALLPQFRILATASFFAMSVVAHANTWVGTTNVWDTATTPNWTSPTTWTTGDDATFNAAGAGIVQVDAGGVTAHNLNFTVAGYTIQGGALTLNGSTPTITTASTTTISSVISGGAGLAKAGAGTLTLSGINNYTGGTTISDGTLLLGNATATLGSNVAANTLTFSGGTFDDNKASRTYNHNLVFTTSTSSVIKTSGGGGQFAIFTGSATGSGNVNFGSTTGNTRISGDWTGFSGTLTASASGGFYINNATSTSVLARYVISVGTVLGGTGTYNFGALSGASNIAKAGGTLSVGALNTDTGYSGIIAGAGSVAKVGTGSLAFSGANIYTGATAVSGGGKLLVNTSHITTATTGGYTVTDANSTLGGTGRIAINANVSVGAGALLAPGAGGIGALTLDGVNRTGDVLTMTTGADFAVELAGDGSSADQLAFWNYTGGDLVLSNNEINLDLLGALAPGTYNVDIFKFFSNAGTTATTHAFNSGLTIGALGANISSATIDWNGTGDNNNAIALNVTIVPEPAAALLGGLGLLTLLRRRRN
jgi:fibronectin-binding autotransporter adhesin